MEPAVVFDNVSFSYDHDLPVLKNVSFSVIPGEFLGIIGPNGGGKTTLLKLIMGFLSPSCGKILIFGKPPLEERHSIAYVPQNLKFDKAFPISLNELVLSGLLSRLPWYGKFSAENKAAALRALERVGLKELQDRAIGTLSGGQMQRGLIARALVSSPKLLLLDEPTANVDAKAEVDIHALLKELSGEVAIMMVTHSLQDSISNVDRVLCVQQTAKALQTKEVCEHFALGLYHAPLLVDKESDATCCKLQVKKEKD